MNASDKLRHFIKELDIQNKEELNALAASIFKDIEVKEFQIKRLEIDSNLINNILTNTIEELEAKKVMLEKQNRLIEEQSRFKETLFANVSHELRTPLHGIIGMSRLLINSPLDTDQLEYVDIVKSSADNLLVIINDILNLSKINSGKIELKNEIFETANLFKDLKGILQEKANRKQLDLSFLISSSLPAFLVGDYTRITQVLLNLLNNAVKFTHKGYVSLSVCSSLFDDKTAELRFEIKDSGIGIQKEKLSQIFDSFIQVHEQKGIIYEGAGLGLNIVRNLLNLMSGTISVESNLGKGTTFFLTIPLQVPEKSVIDAYTKKKNGVTIKESWHLQKMLIIEDNKANLLYARRLLKEYGIVPDEAETIAKSKEFISKIKYDFLLVDVKLPDGNGIDLIKEIRQNEHCPNHKSSILVLTASANELQKNALTHLNISAYLPKPFPPEVLLDELKKGIGQTVRIEKQALPSPKNIQRQQQEQFASNLDKKGGLQRELIIELLQIYLDELPLVLSELDIAVTEQDYKKVGYQAHKFKSNNRFLGLEQAASLLDSLEKSANSKEDFKIISQLAEQFNHQTKKDRQLVATQLTRLKTKVN